MGARYLHRIASQDHQRFGLGNVMAKLELHRSYDRGGQVLQQRDGAGLRQELIDRYDG